MPWKQPTVSPLWEQQRRTAPSMQWRWDCACGFTVLASTKLAAREGCEDHLAYTRAKHAQQQDGAHSTASVRANADRS